MKKSNKKFDRKIFSITLENGEIADITAGGVILYRIINNKVELLLATNRHKYEDLGGRTDNEDKDISNTISREVYEESNKLINKQSILNRIKSRIKRKDYILSKTSKYLLFIIPANHNESKLESKQFGDKEIHDNIPRTICWVPISEFLDPETIKNKLNFRLKNRNIFEYIKKLKTIDNINNNN